MVNPDVSVIIPVYDAEEYVGEAIRSALEQTIAPERLEVVVVDDGSTDGSAAAIRTAAQGDPRVRVLTQENSGTPGGARNPGIDAARGTFVFFLDADDILPPRSLERMVKVAIAEGSDVVLGKLGSTDSRKVPSSMFKRTVWDADLVEDRVFHTLGPTKLIRRSVIDDLDLRFPTDLKVGEDEPFMAAVYLNARKISVLSDTEYYLTRYREDGENMTLAARDSASHAVVALRVAAVVERFTEPGERRDALLLRPFGRPLARALGGRWLSMAQPEREELAEEIRTALSHLYTPHLRSGLPGETAAKLDLLMAGDLTGLAELIWTLEQAGKPTVVRKKGRFERVVPKKIARLFPAELRAVDPPEVTARLEDVEVTGDVLTLAASAAVDRFRGEPDAVRLRLRERGSDRRLDLETLTEESSASPRRSFVRGALPGIPMGVWDAVVVLRFDGWEKEVRLGAERARAVSPDGVSNITAGRRPEDRLVAYFTKGQGNLSVESGAVMGKRVAAARAVGTTLDENSRAVLLVALSAEPSESDEFFGHLAGAGLRGGRQLLPATRLGERLIGVRLPLTGSMTGATLRVDAVLGGVPVSIPVRADALAHWPERLAGYGLEEIAGGGIGVRPVRPTAAPPRTPRPSLRLASRTRQVVSDGLASPAGRRVTGTVKELPVVGPAARSLADALRRGRR